MKSEKHMKSEKPMKSKWKVKSTWKVKTTWKPHENRMLFMRFSKDHLQGIVTLCFLIIEHACPG